VRRRLIVLLAVLSLLGAACGGHDDTESAEEDGAPTSAAPSDDSGEEGGTTAGQFGTMDEPVCSDGDASGATDQGVTDESITVGTLSDAGNTIIPGLLQELFDSANAFVDWCNAAGGINGREIELVERDTKLLEGQQRMAEACAEDFFLVGGASGLDGALAEPRVDCGLPQIAAFTNDPAAQEADLQVIMTGTDPDHMDVGNYALLAEAFPDQAEKFGLLSADTNSTGTPSTERIPTALEQVGIETVYAAATPPPPATVDNWRPYLEPAVDDGVEMFEFAQTAEQVVAAMGAFADVGFEPDVMVGNPSLYDTSVIEGNDALETTDLYVGIATHPFEDAAENPPTQQFLDAMDEAVPGWSDDPKALAINGWSNWLLFAKAASECGSDLTRDCVLENASNVEGWTAGGLQAPVDIVDAHPSGPPCVALVLATPDGFEYDEEVTRPNEGIYNCDESFLVDAPR
jgi:ABC-type branched-subunit amino acid transport system substrate-binding protein